MAQQQAQLTGSLSPWSPPSKRTNGLSAAQPRLTPVQRAIGRDLDRMTRATVTDTAGLLARLDDLVRQVDDLPVQNAVAQAAATRRLAAAPSNSAPDAAAQSEQAWWLATLQRSWEVVRDEARNLVRVSRIDQPEAILLAPEQTFFLRENLNSSCSMPALGCWPASLIRPGPTWQPLRRH
jgi:uroporphyrin-3 C-methyltransferase